MKKIVCLLLIIQALNNVYAQSGISNDGNYVFAFQDISPTVRIVTIRSTKNEWKLSFNGSVPTFTDDEKFIIFQTGDSLRKVRLGTNEQMVISQVRLFKQPKKNIGKWVAYVSESSKNGIHVINLETGLKKLFDDVSDFEFSDNGSLLLLLNKSTEGSIKGLRVVDLQNDMKVKDVWTAGVGSDQKILSYTINKDDRQIAFLVQQTIQGNITNSIWYFSPSLNKGELVAYNETPGIASNLEISSRKLNFSNSSSNIIFKLIEKSLPKTDSSMVKMDIWNYQDAKPQSLQLKDIHLLDYVAVVSPENRRVIQLEHDNEQIMPYLLDIFGRDNTNAVRNNEYSLLIHFDGDVLAYDKRRNVSSGYTMNGYNWNKATRNSIYLVSLKDGSRRVLKELGASMTAGFPAFEFSSGGKYVYYFDHQLNNYFTYEIASGIKRNITNGIQTLWTNRDTEGTASEYYQPNSRFIWLNNDSLLYINDRYGDIWKIDPLVKAKPVNITNGFARRNSSKLFFFHIFDSYGQKEPIRKDGLILCAFDGVSRCENYYRKRFDQPGDPELILNSKSYSYTNFNVSDNLSHFVYERQSFQEPPAYFLGTDIQHSIPLFTNPTSAGRKGAKAELVHWKSLDHFDLAGVLHYPMNFDPAKKYPIVFFYYEKLSWFGANEFAYEQKPEEAGQASGIGDLTKNGFFVFYPDIHYTLGETGRSVYNSLVPAAEALAKRSYIDAKHMGVAGHSFSGFETNLLISQTNMFAAACAGSGMTDMVSLTGTESKDEQGAQYGNSGNGQSRLGTTIWQRPDIYLKNSPIFFADRINTPLLMGIGRKDYRVPGAQGIELFLAMRSQGKKVWLISYDDAGHALDIDFSKRQVQFFEHYLNGKPAPVWMTRGVPARMKGQTLGLQYDAEIKTPGPSLLMDKEVTTPIQDELLKHKTTVNKEGRVVDVKKQ